jgi:hypothetical protein
VRQFAAWCAGFESHAPPPVRLAAPQRGTEEPPSEIASIAYGPDARTRLRPDSDPAFFGAWCPGGIPTAAVESHLRQLALLRREWPEAVIAASVIRHSG